VNNLQNTRKTHNVIASPPAPPISASINVYLTQLMLDSHHGSKRDKLTLTIPLTQKGVKIEFANDMTLGSI